MKDPEISKILNLGKKKLKFFRGLKQNFNPVEQIMWREFFYQMSYRNEKFDQVIGNPMCFKIPWDNKDELNVFNKWEQVNNIHFEFIVFVFIVFNVTKRGKLDFHG